MDTKAAVAFKAGEPLSIETVQFDGPHEGEVLIEMKAFAALSNFNATHSLYI